MEPRLRLAMVGQQACAPIAGSGRDGIEGLAEVLRSQLDLLVSLFRGPVDEAIQPDLCTRGNPVDESVPRLCLIAGTLSHVEMPLGVLAPLLRPEELVLVIGGRRHFTPVAAADVPARIVLPLSSSHRRPVDRVRRHQPGPNWANPAT